MNRQYRDGRLSGMNAFTAQRTGVRSDSLTFLFIYAKRRPSFLLKLILVCVYRTICIGENKGADQLRSYCEADQRLCFRYMDSTILLISKFKISIFQTSTIFSDCTARFVSDMVGIQTVDFLTDMLKSKLA